MGCMESRRHDDENAEAISLIEKTLNFCSNSPNDIENYFKKYAHEGKINQLQLKRIIDSTCLKQPERATINWMNKDRDDKYKTENFYRSFLKKENEKEASIELQPFIISAVLMSRGSASEKAIIIWDNLDLNCTGTITKRELEFYIDTAAKLTQEYLLNYALGERNPNNQTRVLEKQAIEHMKQTWKSTGLKQAFMKQMNLVDDKISQRDFIANISKSTEADFASTYGIREWFLKAARLQPHIKSQNKVEEQSVQQNSAQKQKEQNEVLGGEK